jgi:putative cell wall-binding protein
MAFRKVLGAVAASIALIATSIVAGSVVPAAAFTGSDFDPGFIISDSQFYDNDAMTEHEIQVFLNEMIAGTSAGACETWNCLAVYRTDTWTRAADRNICAQYTGGTQESAARIIFKVQQACGISAKVLLVTLQKEQSLLTATAPSDGRLRIAMGYGCPDTAPCDAQFYGFYNQMYKAAWQFKRYSTPDQWGYYQPGSRYIQYNPNPDCGGSWVNIQNNATAALYNYTPYQPNAQSLANLYGSGGSCGAHGNRNFWTYYYNWFGNPTGVVPAVTTSRIGGSDRFQTSALMSQNSGVTPSVVYIANGHNFPDGLSAGPAAALGDGPVLLVGKNDISASVAAELARLKPARIVVVGDSNSVSSGVFDKLKQYTAELIRVGGIDRYATSREIAKQFPVGTTTAYLATGTGFADALSAGAAAGAVGAPVILVDGGATTLDSDTQALLQSLGVTQVIIAGSDKSVSSGIEAGLTALPGVTVTRLGGANRYETANLIVRNAFPTSTEVFVANGTKFPDALSGAAFAANRNAPLLLSPDYCIVRSTAQTIVDLGATAVTFFGDANALSAGVVSFQNCD